MKDTWLVCCPLNILLFLSLIETEIGTVVNCCKIIIVREQSVFVDLVGYLYLRIYVSKTV